MCVKIVSEISEIAFERELNKIISENPDNEIEIKYSTTHNEQGFNVRHHAIVIITNKLKNNHISI
jgi:hypothetical protein